jgi:hypothetical protein
MAGHWVARARDVVRLAAITSTLLVATACVSVPKAASNVPAFRVDNEASEVSFRFASGQEIHPDTAKMIREQLTKYLDEMVEDRAGGGAPPARYQADITSDSSKGWFIIAPCLIVGIYFGCPMGQATAKVKLTVEVGGKRHVAAGEGDTYFSLYSSADNALTKAAANALDAAFAQTTPLMQPGAAPGTPPAAFDEGLE